MNRRTFLVAGGTVAIGGVAGCLGNDGDGYPTETTQNGVDVPLAPIDDVYEWYQDEDARFVDARSQREYEDYRIEGAVFSPAPDGQEEGDPVEEWEADTRIVTYCICPHSLAVSRAGSLIDDGYEEVYALDEGLREWLDSGYPMAGEEADQEMPSYDVSGQTDPAHADESVWVREPETNQREDAEVDTDGSYHLTLHFSDLTPETVLEVETPDATAEMTLEELTSGTVTV